TIAHYLWYGVPKLDGDGRPVIFYPNVHENCERYSYFEAGKFAKDYGEPYCLYELGCKGPIAHCDVMKRGWNGGVNNCITCGSPCIGCTEPTFPDHEGVGLRGVVEVKGSKIKVA
ncbi:MAG TPA: iron hydrogenase, partial [Proteobacteria bacterium]|nr:iron hydrogenase [Pseudomonadota bacterium]